MLIEHVGTTVEKNNPNAWPPGRPLVLFIRLLIKNDRATFTRLGRRRSIHVRAPAREYMGGQAHNIFSRPGSRICCAPGTQYIIAPRLENIVRPVHNILSCRNPRVEYVPGTQYVLTSRRNNISGARRTIYDCATAQE